MLTNDHVAAVSGFIAMVEQTIADTVPTSTSAAHRDAALTLVATMADTGYGLITPDQGP